MCSCTPRCKAVEGFTYSQSHAATNHQVLGVVCPEPMCKLPLDEHAVEGILGSLSLKHHLSLLAPSLVSNLWASRNERRHLISTYFFFLESLHIFHYFSGSWPYIHNLHTHLITFFRLLLASTAGWTPEELLRAHEVREVSSLRWMWTH